MCKCLWGVCVFICACVCLCMYVAQQLGGGIIKIRMFLVKYHDHLPS